MGKSSVVITQLPLANKEGAFNGAVNPHISASWSGVSDDVDFSYQSEELSIFPRQLSLMFPIRNMFVHTHETCVDFLPTSAQMSQNVIKIHSLTEGQLIKAL